MGDQANKNVEARKKALQEAHTRQALKRKSYNGLDLSSVGSAVGAGIQKADTDEYRLMSKWQKIYGGDLVERDDGTHMLINKNGVFYNNGRAENNKGERVNWNINGDGHFANYKPSLNNQLINLKFKQGGQMYKYRTGAQMIQPQQANGQQGMEQQAIALVQAAMQGDTEANQTIQKIMQAAEKGDQQAAKVAKLLQAVVQQMKGSRKARLGAKLDYIKQSIGECPEGQEVVYFKKGGEICKICAGKKMQDGGKSDPIKNFKKKKEQDAVKQAYQKNPYTRGKSAKEIAEMQRKNKQEAGKGKGENDAKVAPWNYKKR